MLADPTLGGVRELLRADAPRTITRFVTSRGWTVHGLRAVQIAYQPERTCLVRYNVRAEDRSGALRRLSVCIETRAEPRPMPDPHSSWVDRYDFPDPVERLDGYQLWHYPYDPSLKSLQDAASGRFVRDALRETPQNALAVSVKATRYRPRRRATLRYELFHGKDAAEARSTLFAKVMRTSRARDALGLAESLTDSRGTLSRLLTRSRLSEPTLRLSLPCATMGGRVLLFDPMPGRSLLQLLLEDRPLPRPERVTKLLDQVGSFERHGITSVAHRHRRSPDEVARSTSDVLLHLAPEVAQSVEAVVTAVDLGSETDRVPRRIVHGDLYEAQIFVTDDFAMGLIDLDDLGVGDPALDAANFTAHLLALAASRPAARQRILAYRGLLRASFLERLDISSDDLAWREALVMMQLAVGPWRTLQADWPRRVVELTAVAARLVA